MQPVDLALLSPEELERWQLEGRKVLCRRCGLMDGRAVPMEAMSMAVELCGYGGPKNLLTPDRRLVVYRCPACRHRALSEIPEELEDRA